MELSGTLQEVRGNKGRNEIISVNIQRPQLCPEGGAGSGV